jgi:hypothetical protein
MQFRSVVKIADTSSVGDRRKAAVVVRIHRSKTVVAGSLTIFSVGGDHQDRRMAVWSIASEMIFTGGEDQSYFF